MIENRYHKILRDNNQDILDLCPANQTMRIEFALEIKKILKEEPDLKILEMGVGEGNLTKYLLQYNPKLKLDCLDISPEMIESAKQNLGEQNIKFIQDDAYEYLDNPETKAYGIILSAWTIHNFPWKDKIKLFQRIYDKLQEGGIMLLMDKIYSDYKTECFHFLQLQNARYRYLSPEAEEAIKAHEMQDYETNYRMQESQTKEVLEEIGFTEVDILDRIERDAILIARK